MASLVYNANKFLEIKKTYVLKDQDIDKLFSSIFNLKKKTYFKQDFSIEDKKKNELVSYLNKITPNNYNKMFKIMYEICSTHNLTTYLIENIFKLSTAQSVYCTYYVKIIKQFLEKSEEKKEIMDYILEKTNEFKDVSNKNNIKDNFGLTYDEFCENNKLKLFKKGYSQFLGELYLNNIIEYKVVIDTLTTIIANLKLILSTSETDFIEDSILCIEKICMTISNKMNVYDRKKILKDFEEIQESPAISKRLKFKIMDLKESL
tara:strand:- start:85 stop:870 length:786 start_codon:yes stop_codon:yes gene_type:complete